MSQIVVLDNYQQIVVTSQGQQGPPGPQGPKGDPGTGGTGGGSGVFSISTAQDVDAQTLINGSLLVYNATTTKWTATTELANQALDAGEF